MNQQTEGCFTVSDLNSADSPFLLSSFFSPSSLLLLSFFSPSSLLLLSVSSSATAVRVRRGGRGPAGPAEVRVVRDRLCRVLPGPRPVLLVGRTDLLQVLPQQQEVENRGGGHHDELQV